MNSNFFNESTGQCFGNVVVNGSIVKADNDKLYPSFGVLNNGSYLFGYIHPDRINHFDLKFLLQSMIWLVRDGVNIVDKSFARECGKFHSNPHNHGGFRDHVYGRSARLAIGVDASNNLIIMNVDGKSQTYPAEGMNLADFADLLISYGLREAVTMDGGGSTTLVSSGTVINTPSDVCGKFRCTRAVPAFLCLHEIDETL